MSKYLDLDGLEYYTDKIKEEIATKSNFDALSNRPTYNNQQMTHNTNIPAVPTKVSDLINDSDFANKTFVNSSITTNTATFRGTSQPNLTEEQFLSWANTLTKTNNDYVFWNTTDSNGNIQFKRYKYNGSSWEYEYTLNNSSFTAEQWASINSGATTDKLNNYIKRDTVAIVNNMKSKNLLQLDDCDYDNCELFGYEATSAIEDGNYCEIKTYSLPLMIDFDNMTEPKTFTMSCSSNDVNNRSCSALIYGQTTSGWGWTEVGYAENSNSVTFTINPSDYLYIEMFTFRFNQDKNNTFTDTESVFYGFQFEEGNVATNYVGYFDIMEELERLDSKFIPRVSKSYGIWSTTSDELYCLNLTTSGYNSLSNYGFISKGTLERVITDKGLVNTTQLNTKQDTLISGTNIKTINNESILGSGNIVIQGGGGTGNFNELTNRPSYNGTVMSGSTNIPVVPTKTSDLTNDSNFITSSYHDSTKQDTISSSNKIPYSYISGTPTIPTNTISSTSITTVTKLTQAQYNALSSKDSNTMYVIVG